MPDTDVPHAGLILSEEVRTRAELCGRLLDSGDLAGAQREAQAFEGITPKNEEDWLVLCKLCIRIAQRTRAQLLTERFLRVQPRNALAHLANATYYANIRSHDNALREVEAALEEPREEASFWEEVARVTSAFQDYARAEHAARRAIARDSAAFEARKILVEVLTATGRISQARRELNAAARQVGCTPTRWAKLAQLASMIGARRLVQRYAAIATLSLKDGDHYSRYELVRAFMRIGSADAAMRQMKILLSRPTEQDWVWLSLFNEATALGNHDIALLAGEQYLISNCDLEVAESLERLKSARFTRFYPWYWRFVPSWMLGIHLGTRIQ